MQFSYIFRIRQIEGDFSSRWKSRFGLNDNTKLSDDYCEAIKI